MEPAPLALGGLLSFGIDVDWLDHLDDLVLKKIVLAVGQGHVVGVGLGLTGPSVIDRFVIAPRLDGGVVRPHLDAVHAAKHSCGGGARPGSDDCA